MDLSATSFDDMSDDCQSKTAPLRLVNHPGAQEDQSDRQPKDGKPIDWKVVDPRDKLREKRVKELYAGNQLRTGADYYHVAMVLQHATAF